MSSTQAPVRDGTEASREHVGDGTDASLHYTLRYLLEATPAQGGAPLCLALSSPLPRTASDPGADLARARPPPVCACADRISSLEHVVARLDYKLDTILATLGLSEPLNFQGDVEESNNGDVEALPVISAISSPEDEWLSVTQEMDFEPDDDTFDASADAPRDGPPIPAADLENIIWKCRHSRTQCALKLARRLFHPEERVGRTCSGRVGRALDPSRLAWLRATLAEQFGAAEVSEWRKCVQLIDKDSRRTRDRFAFAHTRPARRSNASTGSESAQALPKNKP